jgi:WD40 repeat protein
MDTKTNKMKYLRHWADPLKRNLLRQDLSIRIFSLDYCVIDENIVVPITYSNKLLVFNTESGVSRYLAIGDEAYAGICFDGEWLWLTSENRKHIVMYNMKTKQRNTINYPENLILTRLDSYYYKSCFYKDGFVYLFALGASKSLKLDTKTKCFQELHAINSIAFTNPGEKFFEVAPLHVDGEEDDKLFLSTFDSTIVILDRRSEDVSLTNLTFHTDEYEKIREHTRKAVMDNARLIPHNHEKTECSPDEIIEMFEHMDTIKGSTGTARPNTGETIHKYLKGKI